MSVEQAYSELAYVHTEGKRMRYLNSLCTQHFLTPLKLCSQEAETQFQIPKRPPRKGKPSCFMYVCACACLNSTSHKGLLFQGR